MPWTKTKYPASMKKLPAALRNSAIEIANTLRFGWTKMEEGKLIATVIKHARKAIAESNKKTKPVKAEKKKAKSPVAKRTKKAAPVKTKSLAVKKVKSAGKKKKAASDVNKKTAKSSKKKIKAPIAELPVNELTTPGEDFHIIPVKGEAHPIGMIEAQKVEKRFQHKEEVAFRAENQKAKQSMATRKGTKRIFRGQGR